MQYFLLIVGFILLIKGADIFLDGSISVAKKLRIPSMIIGLTIVAMGTSAPEAAVSIAASAKASAGIAVGNIVGSNIFNLLIVVGLCAVIKPLPIEEETVKRDFPIVLLASVALLLLSLSFAKTSVGQLSRADGIIMLIMIIAYIFALVRSAMRSRNEIPEPITVSEEVSNIISESGTEEYKALSPIKTIIFLILGLAAVIFGGNVVVDSASQIAKSFGLSDAFIGLTIVALGTSLPELVTSFAAAKKGEADMALGNCIGSNIFNILFVLGSASLVRPIPVDSAAFVDVIISIAATVVVFAFALRGRKLSRFNGIIMLILYAVFMAYLFMR